MDLAIENATRRDAGRRALQNRIHRLYSIFSSTYRISHQDTVCTIRAGPRETLHLAEFPPAVFFSPSSSRRAADPIDDRPV